MFTIFFYNQTEDFAMKNTHHLIIKQLNSVSIEVLILDMKTFLNLVNKKCAYMSQTPVSLDMLDFTSIF